MARLDNFILASYGEVSDKRKIAILRSAIGNDGLIAIEGFSSEVQIGHFEDLKIAVIDYLKKDENEIVERHKFHLIRQEEEELFKDFLIRLKAQAGKCNFKILCTKTTVAGVYHDITDELLKDQMVVGLVTEKMRSSVMVCKSLSFDEMVDKIAVLELTEQV